MHRQASSAPGPEGAVLTHVILDMYGIEFEALNDPETIADLLLAAADAASLHPLAEPTVYRYPGQGLTGFLPIRESHVAIHTYPEFGYAAADIVSCGIADQAERARDCIADRLGAERYETDVLYRGFVGASVEAGAEPGLESVTSTGSAPNSDGQKGSEV